VGYKLPALDVEAAPIDSLIDPKLLRDDIAGLPEVSEIDVVRHFTRLSTWKLRARLRCSGSANARMSKYIP